MTKLIKSHLNLWAYLFLWSHGKFSNIFLTLNKIFIQLLLYFGVFLLPCWIIGILIQDSKHHILWFACFLCQKFRNRRLEWKDFLIGLIVCQSLVSKHFFDVFQPSSQHELFRFGVFCQVSIVITESRKRNVSFVQNIA